MSLEQRAELSKIPENTDSAINLKGIWPRRASTARAVHAAGVGAFFFRGGGDLAEAAASAASVQFTAVTEHTNLFILAHRCVFST